VITSRAGDLTEFLSDGVNAFVAAPGDEEDFARAIIRLLDDPAAADLVGKAGQQTCLSRLDYRAHAPDLAIFFEQCAN
jgi:glycosyltransferase involved in cell wall biosynthesis